MGLNQPAQTIIAIGIVVAVAGSILMFALRRDSQIDENACLPVGAGLIGRIQQVTSTPMQEAFAVPSRLEDDVWLVAADLDGSVGVWATSIPPDSKEAGLIVQANDAARVDAVLSTLTPAEGAVAVARAQADTKAIAYAESCLQSG
ncbi:MAG: hypothetical protein WD276_05675 [Actinomycetota bacterium]